MEEGKNVFNIKIAGIPIRVRCRHQENCDFFHSYVTDEEAALELEAGDEDIEFTKAHLRKYDGESAERYSDIYLENLSLMYVLSKKLLDFDVLMIHSSALCMDGNGYLFMAPSGTGKSTHARLWRETFGDRVWMINDDRPMVRLEDGKAVVYGTPWDGKHKLSRNASAPLKAVVWLTRAENNHVERLQQADAFPVLMAHTAWAKTGLQKIRTLQLVRALLETTAFYKLGCNTDPQAAWIAWEGMQNDGIG